MLLKNNYKAEMYNFLDSFKCHNFFLFLATDQQLQDLETYCCRRDDAFILTVDTTFKLCDCWITDTSYRNPRLIEGRNDHHPVFLGPQLIHSRKDSTVFAELAHILIDLNPKIQNLKVNIF